MGVSATAVRASRSRPRFARLTADGPSRTPGAPHRGRLHLLRSGRPDRADRRPRGPRRPRLRRARLRRLRQPHDGPRPARTPRRRRAGPRHRRPPRARAARARRAWPDGRAIGEDDVRRRSRACLAGWDGDLRSLLEGRRDAPRSRRLTEARGSESGRGAAPSFAHASEAELARILDFYEVRWAYEPDTFPIALEPRRRRRRELLARLLPARPRPVRRADDAQAEARAQEEPQAAAAARAVPGRPRSSCSTRATSGRSCSSSGAWRWSTS